MLVRGVVDDQFGDDAQPTAVRLGDELACIGQLTVIRMHIAVLGDVVAVVAPRRGIEGQQPDGVHAEAGDVVQFLDQAGEVADAVTVGVVKRLQMQLVDHRILVPERVIDEFDLGCLSARTGHVATPGLRTHHMAKGRRPGSKYQCCSLPCQRNRVPVISSSTSRVSWSPRPSSHNGTSSCASCA